MKNKENAKNNKVFDALLKNKYALIVVLAGILLLLIPSSGSPPAVHNEAPEFSLYEQERRISETLSLIEGAGKVTVILALRPSVEQVLPPEYLGALVVAEGADNAAVRLELLRAVAGLTGLGTDRITVAKMKNS